MKTFEVWEYGYGSYHRFHYKEISEERAVKLFLDRKVFGNKSFMDHLLEKRKREIRVCVKDPSLKGTRKKPNYPKVFHLQLDFVLG